MEKKKEAVSAAISCLATCDVMNTVNRCECPSPSLLFVGKDWVSQHGYGLWNSKLKQKSTSVV